MTEQPVNPIQSKLPPVRRVFGLLLGIYIMFLFSYFTARHYNVIELADLNSDPYLYRPRNTCYPHYAKELSTFSDKTLNHGSLGMLNSSVSHLSTLSRVKYSESPGVELLGDPGTGMKFAIFCASTPSGSLKSYNYAFYLPLTALAWGRIGFRSIVPIIGTKYEWDSVPALKHILNFLLNLNAVVIFIKTDINSTITMSQVSRFFVMNIVSFEQPDSTYLITSDADLWPLHHSIFQLNQGKKMLSLNWDCCGFFTHEGVKYRMLPVGHIGMSAATWKEVMNIYGSEPKTSKDIIAYAYKDFPSIAGNVVKKGVNDGWYMDQHLVSIRIANWTSSRESTDVDWVSRWRNSRIDRSGWPRYIKSIDGKIDAHMLVKGHLPKEWIKIKPLLRTMYGATSAKYDCCLEYQKTFLWLVGKTHR